MKLKIHLIIVWLCTVNVAKNTKLPHLLKSLSMAVPFYFYNFAFPFFLAYKNLKNSLFKYFPGFFDHGSSLLLESRNFHIMKEFFLKNFILWRNYMHFHNTITYGMLQSQPSVRSSHFSTNISQMLHQSTMTDFSSDVPSANQIFISLVPWVLGVKIISSVK